MTNGIKQQTFTTVGLAINVNPRYIPGLVGQGYTKDEQALKVELRRPSERDRALRELKNVEAAKVAGVDPYHVGRSGPTGQKKADSGQPVFGRQGVQNVKLADMLDDLHKLGFVLTAIYLEEKEGPTVMTKLRLWFKKPEAFIPGESGITLSEKLAINVFNVVNTGFVFCHAFINPNASATINTGHMIAPDSKQNLRSIRIDHHRQITAR